MAKSKIASIVLGILTLSGSLGGLHAATIQAGDYTIVIKNFDSATIGYGNSVGVKCTSVANCDSTGLPALGSLGSVNASADTMGFFSVQSITRGGSVTPYWSPSSGDNLTGIFGSLMDYQVTVNDNAGAGSCSNLTPGNCTTTARSVGGLFSIWANANGPDETNGPAVVAGVISLGVLWRRGHIWRCGDQLSSHVQQRHDQWW